MQFRMAEEPGFAARVNREVVPVIHNATDLGFPEGLPALALSQEVFERSPWYHMTYGFFVLMNSDGTEAYGISGCQCVEHLHGQVFVNLFSDFDRAMDRARRLKQLEVDSGGESVRNVAMESIRAEVREEMLDAAQCGLDVRLMTARYLLDFGAAPWERVLEVLRPPAHGAVDPLEPGVRSLAVRALREFIADDRPFDPRAEHHVEAIYAQLDPSERSKLIADTRARLGSSMRVSDLPIPPSLRLRAARALEEIEGGIRGSDEVAAANPAR